MMTTNNNLVERAQDVSTQLWGNTATIIHDSTGYKLVVYEKSWSGFVAPRVIAKGATMTDLIYRMAKQSIR